MPFPRKLLNDHEDVVLDLRPHWIQLFKPGAALVASLVILIFGKVGTDGTVEDGVVILGGILTVVTLVWFAAEYLKWMSTNFVVTTDRLVYRYGVIAKHGKEIPLERLNDITFHQSIFERMIGAGDLLIESGGERGQQSFSNVMRPAEVQNEIYRQIELAQQRDADRLHGVREAQPQSGGSVIDQLDKLDQLRQRGVISQAEFDAKKAQLLDRM